MIAESCLFRKVLVLMEFYPINISGLIGFYSISLLSDDKLIMRTTVSSEICSHKYGNDLRCGHHSQPRQQLCPEIPIAQMNFSRCSREWPEQDVASCYTLAPFDLEDLNPLSRSATSLSDVAAISISSIFSGSPILD